MVHGVRRVTQSANEAEASKKRDQKLIQAYLELTDDVLLRKKNDDWSEDAFKLTTKLLHRNPEFYTVWNYRRNILLHGFFQQRTPEDVYIMLKEELDLTEAALTEHPKVYWIWNHRRWTLEHIPDGPATDAGVWKNKCWTEELRLIERMLNVDPRNFHVWNYRRYVLPHLANAETESQELAFTLGKIVTDFSNFSAWHQRSKTLSSLWSSGKLNEDESREDELERIKHAMYTEPADQSIWVYHRWLVGSGDNRMLLEREISAIQELLDLEPDSKWCMETLVHYKWMLLKKHSDDVDVKEVKQSCMELLGRLEQKDSLRRNRYREIGRAIEAHEGSR